MKKLTKYFILFIWLGCELISLQAQWIKQNSGTYEALTDIVMLDSVTAVAVGRGRSILRTSDAGKTWENLTIMLSSVVPWNSLSFADSLNGIVVGDGGIRLTSDGGKTWYSGLIPHYRKFLSALYVFPGVIYVGADSGWIYHSLDTGKTWSSVKIDSLPIRSIFAWFGGPTAWIPIFALTPLSLYSSWLVTSEPWNNIPIPVNGLGTEVFDGEFCNNGDAGFIVGMQGDLLAQPKILRKRWQDTGWIPIEVDFTKPGKLHGVSAPSENSIYSCGANGMIIKSTDGGDTWNNQEIPIKQNLNAISFYNNSIGMAVGDSGVILYTKSGGVTPEEVSELVPYGLQDKFITSLTAEESDYSDDSNFYIYDNIFAGTETGVFKASAFEEIPNWISVGLEGKQITALALQHWNAIARPPDGLRLFAAVIPNYEQGDSSLIFLREIYSLTDTNWIASDSGINKYIDDNPDDPNFVTTLSCYHSGTSSGTVLAGTKFGLFRIDSMDSFWSQSEIENANLQPDINAVDVNPNWFGNLAWAAGRIGLSSAAFRSTDQGKTWEFFPLSDIQEYVLASSVAINTRYPDSVYVSWLNSIFLTPDNGGTWEVLFSTRGGGISKLAVDPLHPENVFAGAWFIDDSHQTPDHALFLHSTNGGKDWDQIDPDTDVLLEIITSIAVLNKFNVTYIFIGTAGTGIWSYKYPIKTDVKIDRDIPGDFILYQNYPNPFNPTTTIQYELPKESKVQLFIYNLLGEKIAELANTFQKAGRYEVKWNASNIAGGVYFYQLKADNFSAVKKFILLK